MISFGRMKPKMLLSGKSLDPRGQGRGAGGPAGEGVAWACATSGAQWDAAKVLQPDPGGDPAPS